MSNFGRFPARRSLGRAIASFGAALLLCGSAFLVTTGALADEPNKNLRGQKMPTQPAVNCSCRRPGGKAELGETACIRRNGEWTMARCEMTLNNTSWRSLQKPCAPVS